MFAPGTKQFSAAGAGVTVDELLLLRLGARGIVLTSRSPVTVATAGVHHSRFRGRGVDYQESRNYQAGDDVRNMDWRVTARSGRPHTKLYREERERPVIVLVDFSPSMFFGTRKTFKSVIAARAAALIGWAAVLGGDRIGALLFNGSYHELKPVSGRRGVLRLIQFLVSAAEPESGLAAAFHEGGLGEALYRLRRVARPGSLIVMLSDFYSMDADTERHLTPLRQHNDILACQICDPLELAPPPPGRYGITDGVRSGILDTGSASQLQNYTDWFARHHQTVQELLRKRRVPLMRLITTDDVVETLRRSLSDPGLAHRIFGVRKAA